MTYRFPARRRLHSCAVALLIFWGSSGLSKAAALNEPLPEPSATAIGLLGWFGEDVPRIEVVKPAATTPRVRSEHPVIAAAIAGAEAHSVAFRSMVEAIDGTDGIVYVREGSCRLGVRACLASVHRSPSIRFLYIKVDLRKARGCELMASIGHELQHALEVLGNPKVVDDNSLAHFYMQEGPTGDGDRFETAAAMRMGIRVDKELNAQGCCEAMAGTFFKAC